MLLYHPYNISCRSSISPACSKRDSTHSSSSLTSPNEISPHCRVALINGPVSVLLRSGTNKSRRVIFGQLHCTITCLIRVRGSPSQRRTSSRCVSVCLIQQEKKSAAKPFAALRLSIRAPCLASPPPMPSEGQGQRVSWGGATISSCNTN